jgi:hypothetical protein
MDNTWCRQGNEVWDNAPPRATSQQRLSRDGSADFGHMKEWFLPVLKVAEKRMDIMHMQLLMLIIAQEAEANRNIQERYIVESLTIRKEHFLFCAMNALNLTVHMFRYAHFGLDDPWFYISRAIYEIVDDASGHVAQQFLDSIGNPQGTNPYADIMI